MPVDTVQPIRLAQLWPIGPELLLAIWGIVVLLVDVAWLRRLAGDARRNAAGLLALFGPLAALAMLFAGVTADPAGEVEPLLFYGTISGDLLTTIFNGLIALLLALVIFQSMTWSFTEHWGPYFALLCWAAAAMMILVASEELLILFLSLETMTICLYLASAFEKDRRRSSEAGMKYFVYGSVSSALFLFGLSLVYGLTGTTYLDGIRKVLHDRAINATGLGLATDTIGATSVLLVLVGFGFKVAAVPFHQWAPDTYEGAPAPVAAWIASGSKVASFVALMKVFLHAFGPWAGTVGGEGPGGWVLVLAVVAGLTMTYGNLAALAQRNLKRMLAYSSIAHAGYMLVGVLAAAVSTRPDYGATDAAGSVLFYLAIYSVTTVGAFAAASWLARDRGRDDIADLDGLGYEAPGLAACIVVLMLSLIGLPPLAGFFAKLYMFMEVLRTTTDAYPTMLGLVALALMNSVISAFYYARVLRAMFLRRSDRRVAPAPRSVAWPIVLGALVSLGFGVAPRVLMEPMRAAASTMLSITLPSASSLSNRAPAAPARPDATAIAARPAGRD